MDIPLNVPVYCSDGPGGRSTAIVVERPTRKVTHFVVNLEERQLLVPIEAIAGSTALRIDLHWSRAQLSAAEPFVVEVPADEEHLAFLADSMAGSNVLGPYTSPDVAYMAEALSNATMEQEQVAGNALAIHRDARVAATDGDVGEVDELIIDPATNEVSHLVLRKGHFWGKRDVTIPLNQVDRVEGDVVYLKLDKKAIEQLPTVAAPKK